MKHVIEVPAGHTVLVTREGLNLVIESHESSDGEDRMISMSNVQGLTGASAPIGDYINFDDGTFGFNDLAPGEVVTFKTLVGSEWQSTFAVKGTYNRYSMSLTDDRQLRLGSDCLVPCKCRKATPAEREEFLNNLRDWYALTITETGELVNWRAKRRDRYYYLNYVALPEYDVEGLHDLDNESHGLGNYFPEGFLTDERLAEYKSTVQKLFSKWRGLCQE